MIILVTGGRDYADQDAVFTTLDAVTAHLPTLDGVVLVQGDARGADKLAKRWAEVRGVHCASVPALWNKWPMSAGPKRNSAMLLLKPDILVAFPGGKGTKDMKDKARLAGIQMVVIE